MKRIKIVLLLLVLASVLLFAEERTKATGMLNPDHPITVVDYCDFLNATATTDEASCYDPKLGWKGAGSAILRSSQPGSYHYEALSGQENATVAYLNFLDQECYYTWREQTELLSFSEKAAMSIEGDPLLKSNILFYPLLVPSSDELEESNSNDSPIDSLLEGMSFFGAFNLGDSRPAFSRTLDETKEDLEESSSQASEENRRAVSRFAQLFPNSQGNGQQRPILLNIFKAAKRTQTSTTAFMNNITGSPFAADGCTDTSGSLSGDDSPMPVGRENLQNHEISSFRSPIVERELLQAAKPWNLERIGAPEAWEYFKNNNPPQNPMHIVVVDTGIDAEHELLKNHMCSVQKRNGLVIHGYNAYDDNHNTDDHDTHGTFNTGIISAVMGHPKGHSNQVKFIACKMANCSQSGRFYSDFLKGLQWVLDQSQNGMFNAKIINCSMGRVVEPSLEQRYRSSAATLFQRAHDQHMLLFLSAGNESRTIDAHRMPTTFSRYYENIAVVAATTKEDRLQQYSNYGHAVHLGAPGEDIESVIPRIPGKDNGVGASPAAPHVAGAAAIMIQLFPELEPSEIIERLCEAADSICNHDGRNISNGRLNIMNAIKQEFVRENFKKTYSLFSEFSELSTGLTTGEEEGESPVLEETTIDDRQYSPTS